MLFTQKVSDLPKLFHTSLVKRPGNDSGNVLATPSDNLECRCSHITRVVNVHCKVNLGN